MRTCIGRPGLRCLIVWFLLVSAPLSVAWSCNVPVFRYALEHWRPDAYRAVVFHRGPLSKEAQDQLVAMKAEAETARVNMTLRTVDLDQASDTQDQELLKHAMGLSNVAQETSDFPKLVMQYPAYLQLDHPVWSGSFNGSELSTLFDSTARQMILQRLAAGQTAVWLMVDSGDPGQDEEAATKLEVELKELTRTLKLPVLTDSPEDVIQDGPPVRVEFSLLRLHRDDPAERHLITLLLGCEADLATLKEPMVFPIFGRCRALLPLVGPGISTENIRSSASFLAGACSCQVKELNPGFDLLITANWKELLSWAKSPAFASLENSQQNALETELVPIPAGSAKSPSETASESKPLPHSDTASRPLNAEPVLTKPTQTDPARLIMFIVASLILAVVLATSVRRR